MKKILATFFAVLMLFQATAFTALAVTSIDSAGYLDKIGTDLPGYGTEDALTTIIGTVITTILSILGILLLGMIIFSGFQYMTAGGDSEATEGAVTRIKNATIGLLIIMASYAIAKFVIDAVEKATGVTA